MPRRRAPLRHQPRQAPDLVPGPSPSCALAVRGQASHVAPRRPPLPLGRLTHWVAQVPGPVERGSVALVTQEFRAAVAQSAPAPPGSHCARSLSRAAGIRLAVSERVVLSAIRVQA